MEKSDARPPWVARYRSGFVGGPAVFRLLAAGSLVGSAITSSASRSTLLAKTMTTTSHCEKFNRASD